MIDWFDIGDVNKGAARFDFQKLEALNGALYARDGRRGTARRHSLRHAALSPERRRDCRWLDADRKAQLSPPCRV